MMTMINTDMSITIKSLTGSVPKYADANPKIDGITPRTLAIPPYPNSDLLFNVPGGYFATIAAYMD